MKFDELIKLPIYIQVVLGAGFISYMIAMHGRRSDEKAIDLLFGVIAFSLPSMILWSALDKMGLNQAVGIAAVIIYSALLGVIWRKWGRKWFYKLMNETGVSTDEGYKSAWQRIIQDVDISLMQVSVTLKDSKVLACMNLREFQNASIPKSTIDDDGNIAIYVTHIDGEEVKTNLRDEEWGDLITYIPASEVYCVDFRYLKKGK